MKTSLAVRFPDQSPSFVNGYECGRIAEMMERGDLQANNKGFPIHTENIEVVRRLCRNFGYIPSFSECDVEGWTNFFAIKDTTCKS